MKLTASVRQVRWREALQTAHSSGRDDAEQYRPLVLVSLQSADGVVGYGEAAPLSSYDGVTTADVLGALALYEPVLDAGGALTHAQLLARCAAVAGLPQALAAVDLALWDLAGRRAGRPVWKLLGAQTAPALTLNAVIGAEQPEHAAQQAREAVAQGFSCVKVKVGDAGSRARVSAVRTQIGALPALRIDANGAWAVDEAIVMLSALAGAGLELCEEPVHGVAQLAAVARALPQLTVAADETSADPELFKTRVCGSVCLKISRSGGISGVIRDAEAARAAGYDVYLASTLDGPLGIAAGLHAAAVLKPARPCGLATLDRFEGPNLLPVRDGQLSAPPGDGLGEGLAGWYDAVAGA